jgi:lipoprotein-anchoring transpeptidase ErfK/SrfK/predicted small secreted protein
MPRRAWIGRGRLTVVVVAALALTLAGCNNHNSNASGKDGSSGTSKTEKKPAAAATVAITPTTGATGISPSAPVVVKAEHGTVTTVWLKNAAGKAVNGYLSKDGTTWTSSQDLGYGKPYTVAATAVNADGKATTANSSFTTLQPANLTMPTFAVNDGGTYGVGQIIAVKFDENIPDRAAAEKALVVTTTPALTGAWHWVDSQNAQWRPQTAAGTYWPTGTKVNVTAKVYGVNLGNGLYGQADQSVNFSIAGHSHVAIANDKTLHMKVYVDGVVVKDMPFSGGKGGCGESTSGGCISLDTPSGTMVVLDDERRVHMTSASWGMAASDPQSYDVWVDYGVRLTWDGIYTHSAPWNVDLHGVRNDSHGCLNLDPDDAEWMFNNWGPGDLVQVTGTGEQFPNFGDGYGAWQLSWDQWVAGSALK